MHCEIFDIEYFVLPCAILKFARVYMHALTLRTRRLLRCAMSEVVLFFDSTLGQVRRL